MGKRTAVLVLALAACSPFGGGETFTCATSAECSTAGTAGTCEPDTGLCAFADPMCTSGWRYGDLAGALSHACVAGTGAGSDAGVIADARPDTPPDLSCFGTGFVSACFMTAPSGATAVNGSIDTDNSPMCSTLVVNSTSWCVIAAGDLTVSGVTATGSRPLVLLATATLHVTGSIDVASHRLAAPVNPGQIGPGSVPTTDLTLCDRGVVPGSSGGGAGGSFVTTGANGGNPHAGTAGGVKTVAALRGGCAGQAGVSGHPGAAGRGGGALYLVAATSITIDATIDASGAAGTGGNDGGGGGGGGGAGGMIVLDAPAVTNNSTVFANGGGGGEGAGNQTPGADGNEPIGVAAAAKTANTSPGGEGGAGAAQGALAGAGVNSGAGGGGGGGGGGLGVIKLFQVTTLGGSASPTPTP